jgi:probable phosphoglycerate mutase
MRKNMKTIWLTRHGETQWNTVRRMQGQLNSPLTDNGIRQAEQLAKWLAKEDIDVIYTSPLERAYKTALILRGNRNIPVISHVDLKEIHLGDWQGKCVSDVERSEPEKHEAFWYMPDRYVATSGEDFHDVRQRIQHFCEEVIAQDIHTNILIVAHAIVLKSFIAYTQGLPISELWSGIKLKPTSITKSIYNKDKFSYEYIGCVDHYQDQSNYDGWFIDDKK